MLIEKVLQSVCEVEKEHIEPRDKKESRYNIYKILCVTENEVLMCRILADLLNPQGSHNMGDIYFREQRAKRLRSRHLASAARV